MERTGVTGRRSQVSVQTTLTVTLTALAVVAVAAFLVKTVFAVGITLAAAMISIALHHVVDFLARRGMKPGPAKATVLASGLALALGFGVLVIPPAASQARTLIDSAPELWSQARSSTTFKRLNRTYRLGDRLETSVTGTTANGGADGKLATGLLKTIGGAVTVLLGVVSLLFLTVFMLLFGGRLVTRFIDELAVAHRGYLERVLRQIYTTVGGYLLGLGFVCGVNATLTTVFLAAVGMPYFLPLAFVSGFSSLVPYAGPLFSALLIGGVALATKGAMTALIVVGYFVLYGQLEGHVLAPLVFRRTVHINPLITVASVLFMGELAGVLGAVLAVPIAATLQIVLRELFAMRRLRLAEAAGVAHDQAGPPPSPILTPDELPPAHH